MSTISILSSSKSCSNHGSSWNHSRRHRSKLNLGYLLMAGSPISPFLDIKTKARRSRRVMTIIYSSGDPLEAASPLFPSDPSSWKLWILGMVISAILPLWKNKWLPLITFKQTVDKMVDVVEDVAEAVETVAEEVEKVAEEVADHLPEGGGLQKAALFVENVARKVAEDADMTGDVIDKVEEMENELVSYLKEKADPENGERLEEADQGNRKIEEESKENDDLKSKL